MSIKSDKWIRRMAQEHGMIEPFVERQMRGEGADRRFQLRLRRALRR
jgi:dCTP deaminase